jgi:formate C-acetyltransferase
LEQNIGGQVSNGRMDQYLYPYYAKDIAEGRVAKESAEELLQCLWLNMWQSTEVKLSPSAAASMEGFAHFEPVTIGGQTSDGLDATNDLSYVILERFHDLFLGSARDRNIPGTALHDEPPIGGEHRRAS